MTNIYYDGEVYEAKAFTKIESDESWLTFIVSTIKDWYEKRGTVIRTSGSTGVPKKIVLTHDSMVHSALRTIRYFKLRPEACLWLCLPAQYIAGRMMIYRALTGQMDLYITRPTADPLMSLKRNVQFAAMTPMQLQQGLESCPEKMEMVHQLILGGGPVSPTLEESIRDLSTAVCHTYGMTETVTHVAVRALNGPDRSDSFTALSGISFSQDDNGALIIHTDDMYVQDIITTDLVELLNKTQFMWRGRLDHVINTGGLKVTPESIEERLKLVMSWPFFITAEPDDLLGQRIIMITSAPSSEHSNISKCAEHVLERKKLPKKIYFVNEILETPTGKIKRDVGLYDLTKDVHL